MSTSHLPTIILVHGSWHGGWCFERIVPLLTSAGFEVLTPTLIGMSSTDLHLAETVTVADWVKQIGDIIEAQNQPVILIGHSRGGLVISQVAELMPSKIKKLIYISGFLLTSGQNMWDAVTLAPGPLPVNLIPGNVPNTVVLDPSVIEPGFYNTTEQHWIDRVRSMLCAEPEMAFSTRAQVTPERFGSVPRAYIECLQDNAITHKLQLLMQQNFPCSPVHTMNTDHSPFYSAPEELAAKIVSIIYHT